MGLVEMLRDLLVWGRAARIKQVAHLIAERSQPTVWQRVANRSLSMRPAEACGYIRARAASVIHAHVDRAINLGHDVASGDRDLLIDVATAEVLRRIVRQWVQARSVEPIAVPARKAA